MPEPKKRRCSRQLMGAGRPHELIRPAFCWVLPLMCAASALATAQDYTVEGTLTHTDLVPSVANPSTFQERFRICVSGGNWIISESRDVNGKRFRKDTGFDGTNVFQLTHFPGQAPESAKRSVITVHGSINAQDLPAPDLMFSAVKYPPMDALTGAVTGGRG